MLLWKFDNSDYFLSNFSEGVPASVLAQIHPGVPEGERNPIKFFDNPAPLLSPFAWLDLKMLGESPCFEIWNADLKIPKKGKK